MNTYVKAAVAAVLGVVVLSAAAAGGLPSVDPGIVGTWEFETAATPFGDVGPLPGQTYRVTYRSDGTMTMELERNAINGAFTASAGDISMQAEDTSPSWLPGSPGSRIVELVAQARGYAVNGDALELEASGGRSTLNFSRVR